MVAFDVEKNPWETQVLNNPIPPFSLPTICTCGTRVFKTRVPPFSFRSDCLWVFFFFPCSFSFASTLLHSRSLHLFFRSSTFSNLLLQTLPLLLQISVLLLQILPSILASNLILRFFFIVICRYFSRTWVWETQVPHGYIAPAQHQNSSLWSSYLSPNLSFTDSKC